MPDKNDERMDNAIRFMISSGKKSKMQDMYDSLGIVMSDDLRAYLDSRLAAYDIERNR